MEIIDKIFSEFLLRYSNGKIVFDQATNDTDLARKYSFMITSYHCQESAEEIEELLHQEEKPEKKNIS